MVAAVAFKVMMRIKICSLLRKDFCFYDNVLWCIRRAGFA